MTTDTTVWWNTHVSFSIGDQNACILLHDGRSEAPIDGWWRNHLKLSNNHRLGTWMRYKRSGWENEVSLPPRVSCRERWNLKNIYMECRFCTQCDQWKQNTISEMSLPWRHKRVIEYLQGYYVAVFWSWCLCNSRTGWVRARRSTGHPETLVWRMQRKLSCQRVWQNMTRAPWRSCSSHSNESSRTWPCLVCLFTLESFNMSFFEALFLAPLDSFSQ